MKDAFKKKILIWKKLCDWMFIMCNGIVFVCVYMRNMHQCIQCNRQVHTNTVFLLSWWWRKFHFRLLSEVAFAPFKLIRKPDHEFYSIISQNLPKFTFIIFRRFTNNGGLAKCLASILPRALFIYLKKKGERIIARK